MPDGRKGFEILEAALSNVSLRSMTSCHWRLWPSDLISLCFFCFWFLRKAILLENVIALASAQPDCRKLLAFLLKDWPGIHSYLGKYFLILQEAAARGLEVYWTTLAARNVGLPAFSSANEIVCQ